MANGGDGKIKWASISVLIAVIVYTITLTRYVTKLEGHHSSLDQMDLWLSKQLIDHEQRLRSLERGSK